MVFILAASLSGCASSVSAMGARDSMHNTMHSLDSEFRFLVEMIPHHQEAVDTAGLTAARTSRPELKEFSLKIVTDQNREIQMMQGWLDEWYPGRKSDSLYRPMMRPVEGLSADRADRTFLEDMIMHHRMAVMMANQIKTGNLSDRPELKKLADDIIRTQNSEIEQMENWLVEWYGVRSSGRGMMH